MKTMSIINCENLFDEKDVDENMFALLSKSIAKIIKNENHTKNSNKLKHKRKQKIFYSSRKKKRRSTSETDIFLPLQSNSSPKFKFDEVKEFDNSFACTKLSQGKENGLTKVLNFLDNSKDESVNISQVFKGNLLDYDVSNSEDENNYDVEIEEETFCLPPITSMKTNFSLIVNDIFSSLEKFQKNQVDLACQVSIKDIKHNATNSEVPQKTFWDDRLFEDTTTTNLITKSSDDNGVACFNKMKDCKYASICHRRKQDKVLISPVFLLRKQHAKIIHSMQIKKFQTAARNSRAVRNLYDDIVYTSDNDGSPLTSPVGFLPKFNFNNV